MSLIQKLSPGFRRRCEAIATERRGILRLRAFAPLPAKILAADLGATIFTPEAVPHAEPDQVAVLLNSDQWSAGVICKNPLWIVHNPSHAPTRRESNLMHELAHILLKHKMVGFDPKTGLPQRRDCDEDEATYLGGCLQIPRRGLLWAVQRKMQLPEIAAHFSASEDMVRFRSNMTGVQVKSC